MKAQSERPDISEMPPYRLGRHWNTIQAYLIPDIEDDIGELNEEPRKFSASFDYFYDLADAAYDAAGTRAMSQSLNHVPLIDGNPRRGEKQIDDVGAKFVNIVPAEAVRYRIRTGVERVFGMLKDSHGGCTVRVRGHEKVFLHLMFGILVIAAQKLIGIARSVS